MLETTFTTATGSVTLTDALAVGRNERGHELGAGAVSTVLRRLVGVDGDGGLELSYAPRPEYGLVVARAAPGGRRASPPGAAPACCALSSPVPLEIDGSTRPRRFTRATRVTTLTFALQHRTTSERTAALLDAGRDRRPPRRHRGGVAHVVEPAPGYDGPWARPRAPQRPGAVRADVLPDRRDRAPRRRRRSPRRRAARATGTTATRGCATRRSRSQALWVAACPDEANKFFDYRRRRGGVAGGRRGRPPDHVRHRRRARSDRARAPPPLRLAEQRAGAGRQRRVEPASARRLRRAARRRPPAARPARPARRRSRGRSSPTWPTSPLLGGRRRTRASGRSGASPGTSCTASSCAGSRSTVRSRWPTASTRATASTRWKVTPGRDRRRDPDPTAGTRRSARSPSRSAATSSTRRTS